MTGSAPNPPTPALQGVEAITFDVGGTLIAPYPSVGHIYSEAAALHGVPDLSPELLNERFRQAWKAVGEQADSRTDWEQIVQLTFSELGPIERPNALFASLYDRFMEPSAWVVFPDVVPALEALKREGKRLGVVSNWDERLKPLLRRLNLSDYFEITVVSCEVGCAKPSRGIFDAALSNLSLEAEQVMHVGDSINHDLGGARAAGLQARGIRRDPEENGPDWINDLRRLLEP